MGLYKPEKVLFLKLFYFLFFGAGVYMTLGAPPWDTSLYKLGQIFGTLSLTALSLQLWMGARVKALEEGVGLDKIMKYHKLNGKLVFTFVILHPLLIIIDLQTRGFSLFQIVRSFTIYHYFGILAFLLIMFTIVTTIYQASLKINYEYWKVIHKIGYAIVILGFTHSFFVGSDISSKGLLYYWWMFLAVVATFAVFYRYIIRKYFFTPFLYEVVRVHSETHDVRSIYLKPIRGKVFSYSPGQFAFVKFISPNVPFEEHHFTISSHPSSENLTLTIKESGDFTSELGKLRRGDRALVEGPFGVFSNEGIEGPFIFVAGGIGITPIMSMIRSMKHQGRFDKAALFYSAKTKHDFAFHDELEHIKKKVNWLSTFYFISQESFISKSKNFYTGHITAEIIEKFAKNLKMAKFFIVGPPPMMDAVVKELKLAGVSSESIFTERFALK